MIDLSSIDFKDIYVSDEAASKQPARYENAVNRFYELFGEDAADGEGAEGEISLFSAPGRTEIGGNHTDHQHGEVLAASINRDVIAVARKNGSSKVRIKSDERALVTVDIGHLDVRKEAGSTALVRGMLRGMKDAGYEIGGFDAYTTSDVLVGAGISSSAAFETLVGTVISGLFNDMKADPVEIAKVGQYAENVYFGKPCGLMDQMACSVGNLVHIDFKYPEKPLVERVDFDFTGTGYCICITDTKGSHSDLTHEYAAVPSEMRRIASLLGHEVLRDVSFDDILNNVSMLRSKAGDRAVLRAIHFVTETKRSSDEAKALGEGDLYRFLKLVKESGNSSFKYLQNIYSNDDVTTQNVSLALAVSDAVLGNDEVSRVHGGGFAGTIQAFVKAENTGKYREAMDKVFGEGSCVVMNIRRYGGMKVL